MRAYARQLKAWTGLVSGVFIVLVVVLAGCGSTSSQAANTSPTATAVPPTAASTTAPTATTASTGGQNAVSIVGSGVFSFAPPTLTVKVGTTVKWTNTTLAPHTATSDSGSAQAWDSSDIEPGGTFSFTFTKAGTFAYHCSVHPSMHGTIVVTP